jgi:hypothetical protein
VRPSFEDYQSEDKATWASRRRRELSFAWNLLLYEHQQMKDERRYGENDAVVGTTKLKGRLASQLKRLTRKLRADFAGMKESLLAQIPATAKGPQDNSLTHRLAAHFPELPLCNYMVTTGGPVSNHYLCFIVMGDMLDRFNTWADASGFTQFVLDALDRNDYKFAQDCGGVQLSFNSRCMWSGMLVCFTKDGHSVGLSIRRSDVSFSQEIVDTDVAHFVAIMESFMRTWSSPPASYLVTNVSRRVPGT